MRVHLDYRHPTPSHCDVAVFINGALAGILTLRREEVGNFQQIVSHGCIKNIDTFEATGAPE